MAILRVNDSGRNSRQINSPEFSDEHASCVLCGSRFSDSLAWAAHRPWRTRWYRDRCRWPASLYNTEGVWTLRPSAVAEVRRIENGPADEFKSRPATWVAAPAQETPYARAAKNSPSNGAGSRASRQ